MYLKFISHPRDNVRFERTIEAQDFYVATHFTEEPINPGDNSISRIDVTVQRIESDGCAPEQQTVCVLTPDKDKNWDGLWVMNDDGDTIQSIFAA